jgi:regulator of RNase E activity RraA
MFEDMPPHSVMVIDSQPSDGEAHFGDITALLLCGHKGVGAVVDGYTRDSGRILKSGWGHLTYCRGTNPVDAYGRWAITNYNRGAHLSGMGVAEVPIYSGDWVFGDSDGVMVIRADRVVEVCELAEKRALNETMIRAALGREPPLAVYERLGRW